MTFADAVRRALSQYATFTGRARRSEYWFFYLFTILLSVVTSILDLALGTGRLVNTLVSLALLLPSLAVSARRLHDTGRSGWWMLLALTIIGIIPLIIWYARDSDPDNQYGPNPKGATGMPGMPPPGPPYGGDPYSGTPYAG